MKFPDRTEYSQENVFLIFFQVGWVCASMCIYISNEIFFEHFPNTLRISRQPRGLYTIFCLKISRELNIYNEYQKCINENIGKRSIEITVRLNILLSEFPVHSQYCNHGAYDSFAKILLRTSRKY